MGLLESLVSIKNIKDSIKNSLSNKGITMTNKTFSDYPSIIDSLDLEKHTLVEKSQTLTTNGTHTLNCDTNKPFSKVTTTVNVNNKTQTKTKSITSNGTVDITPDSGYIGMSKVSVTTNVQPKTQTKSKTISSNGTTTISPDSGYDGLSSVSVTTNVEDYEDTRNSLYNKYMVSTKTNDTTMNTEIGKLPTIFTPIKTTVSGKTYYDMNPSFLEDITTSFQNTIWNTRGVSITDLFLNIDNSIPLNLHYAFAGGYTSGYFPYTIQTIQCKNNVMNVWDGSRTFMNCRNLKSLPIIDLSNNLDCEYMFSGCYGLTEIHLQGRPNINGFYNRNGRSIQTMYYMFRNCTGLTSIYGLDITNTTNLSYAFFGCTKLQFIDFSETTDYVSGITIDLSSCTGMTTENLVKTIMTLPDNTNGKTVTIKLTSTQMTNLMNYKSGTTSTGGSIWDVYPAYAYIIGIKKITLSTS